MHSPNPRAPPDRQQNIEIQRLTSDRGDVRAEKKVMLAEAMRKSRALLNGGESSESISSRPSRQVLSAVAVLPPPRPGRGRCAVHQLPRMRRVEVAAARPPSLGRSCISTDWREKMRWSEGKEMALPGPSFVAVIDAALLFVAPATSSTSWTR